MFERIKRLNFKTVRHNLVIAAFDGKNNFGDLDELFGGKFSKRIKKGQISSKVGEVTAVTIFEKINTEVIYFVGMGKPSELDFSKVRKSFSKLGKTIEKGSIVVLDSFLNKKVELSEMAELIAETITISRYKFDDMKSKKVEKEDFDILFNCKVDYSSEFAKGMILGEATNNARSLVNTPHNHLNAEGIAEYAMNLASENQLEIKIYDKDEIVKMKMGAFLAVNQGSLVPTKLIVIKYQGKKVWDNPVALVGKGLMFDSGGYNLKSNSKNMKTDMAGSATVLGAIEAISKLKLDENIMMVIAATDNMIGKEAFLPDDVITAANGKTIEIFSTDAEGRLTLADALWFAQQEGAKRIIDVATLTGSIVAALGGAYVGAFTNNTPFLRKLKNVAKMTTEPIWHMPIGPHFKKSIKGKIADINNGGVRLGGASAAAAFLEEFIEKGTKWIHLDIAGSASKAETGATGIMVRTLTKLFE